MLDSPYFVRCHTKVLENSLGVNVLAPSQSLFLLGMEFVGYNNQPSSYLELSNFRPEQCPSCNDSVIAPTGLRVLCRRQTHFKEQLLRCYFKED